jgi:hypothetical protein
VVSGALPTAAMLSLFLDIAAASVHPAEAPIAHAVEVGRAPALDGRLDDDVWRHAQPTDAFTQKFPKQGTAPRDSTTVRIVYDRQALYVAVDCAQRAAPVVARMARRDRTVEADRVTISLDTKQDGKSAFEFSVNAAGVLADRLRSDDTDTDDAWDEVWDARTQVRDDGWSAEFMIPFRILRYRSDPDRSWGLQVRRYTSLTQEIDEFAFIPRDAGGEVSRYGRLVNLRDLPVAQAVELRPFFVGKYTNSQETPYTLGESGVGASAGMDVKWHPTPRLTLDASFNPDFAQVEADRVVFNLTNLEIELPEKRPFFLEAADTYETPLPLLYTRRLGRVAPSAPPLLPGQRLVSPVAPAQLYGALKLTGQLGDRTHVATLTALEGENTTLVDSGRDLPKERILAPLNTAQVLRLKQDIGLNAHLGMMVTARTRAETTSEGFHYADVGDPRRRQCPDGAAVPIAERCFHDSYAAAIDGRWRSTGGDFQVSGQIVGTTQLRGQTRTLLDGTRVGPGDADLGGKVRLEKDGGKPWFGSIVYTGHGKRVDYGDLGFMPRQNEHHLETTLEHRTFEPAWLPTLETRTRLEVFGRRNFDGLRLAEGYQLNSWMKFTNFWQTFFELQVRRNRFDDREIGDGTALERGGLVGVEAYFATDSRRSVRAEFYQGAQRLFSSAYVLDGDAMFTFRTFPRLDLEVGPQWTFTGGEPRYVASTSSQVTFGELQAASIGGTIRATYTFAPRITFQAFAQLFLASGHYSNFSSAAPPGRGPGAVVRLDSLMAAAPPTFNPDFREAALNTSLVFRWEYVLGSTLFLVYSRAQVPSVTLEPGERGTLDFGALRRAPASNVLLLKVSYFLG